MKLALSEDHGSIQSDEIRISGYTRLVYSGHSDSGYVPQHSSAFQSLEISFDKVQYNPLRKTYICTLDSPLVINAAINQSGYASHWDIYLSVSHPAVRDNCFGDKHNEHILSSTGDSINIDHIDCTQNFAIAGIQLAFE